MHEQSLFIEALEKRDPVERAAFLDQICGGDPVLRQRIERLLQRHQQSGGFLDSLTTELPATVDAVPTTDQSGTVIGPYKLLEQIGEGGFGIVFMAEQTQPIRRKVAVKILKPGMDTRHVVARFEAERQALALMDHPNIAHVFDGGETAAGRPYFVMELVRGIPITDFCDQSRLSIRERLKLFIDVCQAVQHAHHKGIIHRDIKPSNVMVTLHDGKPVVKVIDFGIAKATGQQLTDKTLFTNFAQMIGTPLYMSPEQAGLSGLDVDTRSDIYSLGVLIYEMLTGTTPFDRQQLREASYDEIRRIIREEEPARPSNRLSTLGQAAVTVSMQRRSEPKRLSQLLRGELDWIVMKALEKDRNRRYETANGLADDVRRYLADEPVQACPPSLVYRLQKFSRKHGKLLATAAAFALLLMLAMAGLAANYQLVLDEKAQTIAAYKEEAKQRRSAERHLHRSYALLAQQAWERGDIGRLRTFLGRQRPSQGKEELRGWEWYYLRTLLHRDLFTLRGHQEQVHAAAFSPDGRWLATAGADTTVRIWDTATGQSSFLLHGHTEVVRGLSFHPDGRRLASASEDGTLMIWDVLKGCELTTLRPARKAAYFRTAVFSPDGRQLASTSSTGTIYVWDSDSGQELMAQRAGIFAILGLAYTPDGGSLVTADLDGQVRVLDMSTGKLLATCKGPSNVRSLALSPDGRRLALGSDDAPVEVREVATGDLVFRVAALEENGANAVTFSPDGIRLAVAGGQTVRLYDSRTTEPLLRLRGASWLAAFSPDGKRLATGGQGGTVKIWDANASQESRTIAKINCLFRTRNPGELSFGPDSRRLAAAYSINYVDLTVKVWDTASGQEAQALTLPAPLTAKERATIADDGRAIPQVAFSPNGRLVAFGNSAYSAVSVWNIASNQPIGSLPGHEKGTGSLTFSPDSQRLASVGGDRTVRIWDVVSRSQLLAIKDAASYIHSLAFSPDGSRLAAACGRASTVHVWDARTGQELFTLRGHADIVHRVAFSPDSRFLTSASFHLKTRNGELKLWDAADGREIYTFPQDGNTIEDMAFSPDSRRLVVAGWKGGVRLYDVTTGEEIFSLAGSYWGLAFSPDGRRLAAGETNRNIKLWDATLGYQLEGDASDFPDPESALPPEHTK